MLSSILSQIQGRNRLIIVGLAALLVLGGGYALFGRAKAPAPKVETASHDRDTVRVTGKQALQVQVEAVESFAFRIEKSAIGQIAFNEDASTNVFAPFSGRITRLIAKLGDDVKRGMPLFEIDSPDVVQAQSDLIGAAQGVEKAKNQYDLAKRAYERQNDLYAARAVSQKEFEQARNDMAAAESDWRVATGNLAAARNRLRVLGRNDAEISRTERERTVNPLVMVSAPIDGTVVARKVGPGQYVRPDNTDPVYSIADLGTMWLKANVSENDIAYIRPGQDLELRVNALPDKVFRARVTSVGASSDPVTHRVVVRSEIENSDRLLKPEMFARFRINTGEEPQSPSVPVKAVVREGNIATLWVQTEAGVYQRRVVRMGVEQDGRVQILEGVAIGEQVAVRGAIFLDNEWQE